MRNLLITLLTFISLDVYGQQVQQWTLPSTTEQVSYEDTVRFRLRNTGTTRATFRPLFSGAENMQLNMPADIFQYRPVLVQWVSDATIGIDPVDHILVMSERLASLFKNHIWKNSALINFISPESFSKDFALMAGLAGTHSTQCGNYAQFAASIMCETGHTTPDQFRLVSILGKHTFPEIRHAGKWKIADFDLGMPGFMTASHLDHQELAELGWPAALPEFAQYQFHSVYTGVLGPSNNLFSWEKADSAGWSNYFVALTGDEEHLPLVHDLGVQSPYETDGAIILPPEGSLSIEYVEDFLRLDSTDAGDVALIEQLLDLVEAYSTTSDASMQQEILNEVVAILATRFGISEGSVSEGLMDGSCKVGGTGWHPFFRRHQIASYIITVPPGDWEIGTDIKAPGKVMSVEMGPLDEVHLWDTPGDDTTFTGPFEVLFWNVGEDPAFDVPHRANHYLQHGYVHAVDTVRFRISWNPAIFNFLHGQLTIQSDQLDQLQVSYLINGQDFLQGEVVSVQDQGVEPLDAYPNPVSQGGTINFPEDTYTLYNSLGMRVKTCSACSSLTLDGLNPGTYMLVGSYTQRIVIQ